MYCIWDIDNSAMVCNTDNRKEAFTSILNHLIKHNDSEIDDPMVWPLIPIPEQITDINIIRTNAWSVISQAHEAYNRITGFIPM